MKAYKTSETKSFFPYKWFDQPDKMKNTELSPFGVFYSKLRSCNLLETEYMDYFNVFKSGLNTEQAVFCEPIQATTKWKRPLSIPAKLWKLVQIISFKDLLQWHNNNDNVPVFAMQTMITLYHDRDIDMLKAGCTSPNLANICLHKITEAKIYRFMEAEKDLVAKIREDVVGGLFIVFTRKAVDDENFIRKSTNICKPMVGVVANQLHPIIDVTTHARRSLYAFGSQSADK